MSLCVFRGFFVLQLALVTRVRVASQAWSVDPSLSLTTAEHFRSSDRPLLLDAWLAPGVSFLPLKQQPSPLSGRTRDTPASVSGRHVRATD